MSVIGTPDLSEINRDEWATFVSIGIVMLSTVVSALLPEVLPALNNNGGIYKFLSVIYEITGFIDDLLLVSILYGALLLFFYFPNKEG